MHGQKWRVPLGACAALSLASAREAAAATMGDVAKGRNPAAEPGFDARCHVVADDPALAAAFLTSNVSTNTVLQV